jgi:hypothetical protein
MRKILPSTARVYYRIRRSTLLSFVLVAAVILFVFQSENATINNEDQRLVVLRQDVKDGYGTQPNPQLTPSKVAVSEFSDSKEKALSSSGIIKVQTQSKSSIQNNSATELNNLVDSELLPPHRLCRVKASQVNKRRMPMNEPLGVPYQCAGPSYEYFSKKIIKLISNPIKYGKDPKKWGRRSLPFPPNGTVMFTGNSHTRQVFQSLMCQYQQEIISITPLSQVDSKGSGIWDVRIKQNVTVYGVFNVPHVYSPRWMDLLTASLNRSLDSFDMIVLGKFNGFDDSKGTSFAELMKSLTAGTDADFERRRPPDVDAVAQVYAGPILVVSMFANHDVNRTQDVLKKIEAVQESGRRNIAFIDGRKYVQFLGECATDKSDIIGTCSKDFSSLKKRGKNGHRCVGVNGGHPDLVAWDIIEECYRQMSKN